MEDIFERVTLEIEGVKYVVESESSIDARENLLSKFKQVIKEDLLLLILESIVLTQMTMISHHF